MCIKKGSKYKDSNGVVIAITNINIMDIRAFNVIRYMAMVCNKFKWFGTIIGVSVIDFNNLNQQSPKVTCYSMILRPLIL